MYQILLSVDFQGQDIINNFLKSKETELLCLFNCSIQKFDNIDKFKCIVHSA